MDFVSRKLYACPEIWIQLLGGAINVIWGEMLACPPVTGPVSFYDEHIFGFIRNNARITPLPVSAHCKHRTTVCVNTHIYRHTCWKQ